MGLRADQANITITVSRDTHDRLHDMAAASGESVSAMLNAWITAGIGQPVVLAGKRQTVRAVKDELMVSLPMDFVHRCDIHKKDVAKLSYSENTVLITFKKV